MALQAAPGQRPDSSPGTNSPLDCSCPGSAYRIALGPRAGQKVLTLHTVASREEKNTGTLCADAHGSHLHHPRLTLANGRLSPNGKGPVVLRLKSPYRYGTTPIVMQPQEFMQRLATLVPRARLHLIRFHGVLASHACGLT